MKIIIRMIVGSLFAIALVMGLFYKKIEIIDLIIRCVVGVIAVLVLFAFYYEVWLPEQTKQKR